MTRSEQRRVDLMRYLGCAACASCGWLNLNELELHHLIEGNRRLGDSYTIFLCRGHHQGVWDSVTIRALIPKYRVAISDGRKRFNTVFVSERSLWERVQVTINDPTLWPSSKLVPRRVHG
jgi:hypothetical protein